MATTVDHPADSDSPLASRARELTARFVNDAPPYLNQLDDRARRMTHNAVDAEDLVQETRGFAGFNAFSDENNLRAWLFRIMTNSYINGLRRAQHHPSEYLADRRIRPDKNSWQGPRSAELDGLHIARHPIRRRLGDIANAIPAGCFHRDIAGLRCQEIAEIMACCEGTVSSRCTVANVYEPCCEPQHGRA